MVGALVFCALLYFALNKGDLEKTAEDLLSLFKWIGIIGLVFILGIIIVGIWGVFG